MLVYVLALVLGLIIGGIAYELTHKRVTVTITVPLTPSTLTAYEPTFTAYRDGDVCMMQFWTFEAAQAWASESYRYEIYRGVGELVGTRTEWKFDVAPTPEI